MAREDPSGNEPTEDLPSDDEDAEDDDLPPQPQAKPPAATQAPAGAKPAQRQALAASQAPTQPRGRAAGEPRAGTMAWEGVARHADIHPADSPGADVQTKRARARSPTKASLHGASHAEVEPSIKAKARGRGADEPRAGTLGWEGGERGGRAALADELVEMDPPVKRARRQSPEQSGAAAKGNGPLPAAGKPRGRAGTLGFDGAGYVPDSGLDADPRGGLVSRRSGEGSRAQAGLQGIESLEEYASAQPRGRGALERRSGLMGWDNSGQGGESRQVGAAQRTTQQVAQRKSLAGNLFRSAVIGAAQQ